MNTLHHAVVHTVNARGVFYTIPRNYGAAILGPALTHVSGLVPGERVVLGLIGDSMADPVVLSRITPEPPPPVVPEPLVVHVRAVEGVWPPRPTDSAEVCVLWVGAAPFPPVVTEGTGGMLSGVDVPLTAAI